MNLICISLDVLRPRESRLKLLDVLDRLVLGGQQDEGDLDTVLRQVQLAHSAV